jgi:hypothetical protein
MENEAIDLVAVASAFGPEHRKLANLILQLRDLHSIRTDLHLANDFLGTMDGIKGQASNDGAGGRRDCLPRVVLFSPRPLRSACEKKAGTWQVAPLKGRRLRPGINHSAELHGNVRFRG